MPPRRRPPRKHSKKKHSANPSSPNPTGKEEDHEIAVDDDESHISENMNSNFDDHDEEEQDEISVTDARAAVNQIIANLRGDNKGAYHEESVVQEESVYLDDEEDIPKSQVSVSLEDPKQEVEETKEHEEQHQEHEHEHVPATEGNEIHHDGATPHSAPPSGPFQCIWMCITRL